MGRIRRTLHRFLAGEEASITVEAVIALPVVTWAVMATFVFFDAFRVNTTSQKAAYTVADALSRQTDPVNVDYINGMNQLHDILARTRNPTAIRISSIGWEDDRDEFLVIWSVATREGTPLTDAVVNGVLAPTLPEIPEGETFVLVETTMDYTPLFRIGIPAQTFRQAVVTRPRFAPQIVYDDGTQLLYQEFTPTCDDGNPLCNNGDPPSDDDDDD